MKKILSLLLAALLIVTCFAGCGEDKANEIFIGATGPLTGDASSYGISVNNGAMLAVEEINAQIGGLQ